MSWKDISSYSQSDKTREPKSFEFRAAGIRLVLTRHRDHEPDEWVLNCVPYSEGVVIGKGTAEEAKNSAIDYVKRNLEKSIQVLLTANDEVSSVQRPKGARLSAGLGLRFEQHRDGRLAALEALAIVETENKRLRDIIDEIHAWSVCSCIATPEDMMQNMHRVVEITSPNV